MDSTLALEIVKILLENRLNPKAAKLLAIRKLSENMEEDVREFMAAVAASDEATVNKKLAELLL